MGGFALAAIVAFVIVIFARRTKQATLPDPEATDMGRCSLRVTLRLPHGVEARRPLIFQRQRDRSVERPEHHVSKDHGGLNGEMSFDATRTSTFSSTNLEGNQIKGILVFTMAMVRA